jgi:hypothetical protein
MLRKVFKRNGLCLYFGGKVFVFRGCAGKVLISDEKERALVIFEAVLIVPDWEGETCHEYVIDVARVKRFWGLTCDFWAEFEENKTRQKAKAIKSVASPFGLRSGPSTMLRAERWPLRGWF